MELTSHLFNKQIRATIGPHLRERGLAEATTTVGFAHPNADVVHRIPFKRFSDHHRQVMSLPCSR